MSVIFEAGSVKCYPIVIAKLTKYRFKDTQWYEDNLKKYRDRLTNSDKDKVLEDGSFIRKVQLVRRSLHSKSDVYNFDSSQCLIRYEDALRFDKIYKDDYKYIVTNKFLRNSQVRKKRLKDRIEVYSLFGDCYFFTLTFEERYLKLTDFTRRRYVSRFLSSISNFYLANIDFGSENNREHYHGIIQLNDISKFNWKYGFYNLQLAKITDSDTKQLAAYIDKLVNHAFKVTTKNKRIIYSKNAFKKNDKIQKTIDFLQNQDYLLENKKNKKDIVSLLRYLTWLEKNDPDKIEEFKQNFFVQLN